MDFIEELKKERTNLQNRIDAIDSLLETYGVSTIYNPTLPTKKAFTFPVNGRTDKQILWLFENECTHGVKLSDVQDLYDKYTGKTDTNINNVARRLKRERKLVIVKYNGMNKSSFWGLPEWIEGDDFKADFRPPEDLLPISITFSEIVIGDKE